MGQFEDEKPILIVSPSIFTYIIPILLIFGSLIGWALSIPAIPLLVLCLLTIGSVLNPHLSILVFKDRFNFRYRNFLGKLMEINNEFYFQDVRKFESNVDQWRPNFSESIVIIVIGELLGGRWLRHLTRAAKIEIRLVSKDTFGSEFTSEFELNSVTKNSINVIKLIHQKLQ